MSLYENLEPKTRKVVNRIVRGSVNFLSGTVSPAKSDPETMDIEAFSHAMEHYAKRGVEKVILQPKYMGSRGQVYVYNALEKCFAVSRNGFKINHVDMEEVFKERHDFWFGNGKNTDLTLVIEDGEIMPWRALGDKLIEENFERYSDIYHRELDLLQEVDFDVKGIQTLNDFGEDEKRAKDIKVLRETEHTYCQRVDLEKFDHQLELFGQEAEVSFMPFNILKKVYTDGTEEILMDENEANFAVVGKDKYFIVNPLAWKSTFGLADFLKEIEDRELEGIMVKPCTFEHVEDRELRYAPYLKVRNPEYLRIVYGPDYTNEDKLKQLVRKKSIGRKVGASIKEYNIGHKLLQIPVGMLDSHNQDYKEFVSEALVSFEKDKELDPRL